MAGFETNIRFLATEFEKKPIENIVADNPAMRSCLALARTAAGSSCPVLVTGENGCGKTLVASYLHHHSDRRDRPFVVLKCAGMRDNELRTRLFGPHAPKRGGIRNLNQPLGGLLGQAAGGTLLLKNVELLSNALQRELLRILDEYSRRDGDSEAFGAGFGRDLGVRLVATAHTEYRGQPAASAFLEDLLFILGEITLRVPPLRERREDLDPLTAQALKAAGSAYGKIIRGLSRSARDFMAHYSFPGNVQELFNMIHQAVRRSAQDAIYVEDLGWPLARGTPPGDDAEPRHASLAEVEKHHINRVLLRTGWKKSAAARLLHISESMLARKIKLYGLERGD